MSYTPNLRHLLAALEIQQRGSISSAATHIHLSQSAITQGLKKLENALGVELFQRTHDGLTSTEAGRIFLHRTEAAIKFLSEIDSILRSRSPLGPRATFRSMTISQLRAVTAVVEHGSYTLAARHLKRAQPSVHRAVKDAERACATPLFQKSPGGVDASWQARQIARCVSLFFAEMRQGVEELREFRGEMVGRLRIGSLPLGRTRLVPEAVIRLLKRYPEAKVSIMDGPYDEQLYALLHGHIDVIVGALRDPSPSTDIVQHLLFHDSLGVVVRPGHPLQNQEVGAAELRNLDWIAPREDTPAREAFAQFFERSGLEPPAHVIECSSLVATRALLMASDRAALLSELQVEVEVSSGLLRVCTKTLQGTRRDIGITHRREWQPTRIQRTFLDLLRQSKNGAHLGIQAQTVS